MSTTAPRHPGRRSLLGAAGALALAGCSGVPGPEPVTSPDGEPPSTPGATPTAGATAAATTTATALPFVPAGLDTAQRTEHRYGDHARQVADLWLPVGTRRDALVVLVHGGGWGAAVDRRDVNATVADLVGRGWPVLNTDYRGVGDGGGWPGTFTDVATAVDTAADVAAEQDLPAGRVLVLGHSAGAHLAVWAAARHRLPAGAPGAGPRVVPAAACSTSGALHPTTLGVEGGDPNCTAVFGGTPAEVDDRYAVGDPTRLVALGMPLLVVHGTADGTVPVSQSQEFADAAAAAGDEVRLELPEGVGHLDPLAVDGVVWPLVRGWVESVLG
ncbi:alpha/beta fold hydrolase [Paenibacillus sp. TRM 82003]|uniref:alpha/beta hydrolase family protein n=1 Tax=Kineococcus sp. TRM81007 TaxID=2925831 RepID=UPI001F566BBA|nr:alpha/beta fold hydrolase [Kineococcus sp. TRM81007]MCI2238838.1 alpha/beta fold hydrolase [Kineococcus sp. TRM81007]MCI3924243.1 alpha/beta fold hydrolase [Paenibacillus sp. TRM 82003]